MTFRINRLFSEENALALHVRGRVDIEYLNTLKELIEAENAKIVLDLSEVTLAGRAAATFFAVCERNGIELRNCPLFFVDGLTMRGSDNDL
jgi:anti-anti-sigma regulatory factor